jgi:heptosyltransferase-3
MRRGSKKNRLLDYWAGIPVLNLAATLRRRRSRPSAPPRKIGVMCSPALGDTLIFSAALQDIHAAYPDAEIVHCCMGPNKGAAAIIPGADRRIVIDLTRPDKSLKLLRPERFDLFLDYSSWQRLTAFLTLFSGANFTAGFTTPGMYRGRGYDMSVEHRRDLHEVDNFRQLTRALGLPATHVPALAPLPPQNLTSVWPAGFERPVILMHLWPSGQRAWLREWPEDRWLQLAQRLAQDTPGAVFGLTGTPAEMERTEPFLQRMRAAGLEAHAVLANFSQLATLLQRAHLVVSVNTGVMHLAAIAGVPTVSINGPNSNGRWGPVGPRAFGVESHGEGCGYLHLGFDFDGKATDCMERISVEEVLAACHAVLIPEGRG